MLVNGQFTSSLPQQGNAAANVTKHAADISEIGVGEYDIQSFLYLTLT